MAGTEALDSWWDGLSEQERADAIRAGEAGQLSEGLERSLAEAGLIDRGARTDRVIPGQIREFLKMRH